MIVKINLTFFPDIEALLINSILIPHNRPFFREASMFCYQQLLQSPRKDNSFNPRNIYTFSQPLIAIMNTYLPPTHTHTLLQFRSISKQPPHHPLRIPLPMHLRLIHHLPNLLLFFLA